MIDLPYSLVIEATEDKEFFGFFSPDLEGFTGIGHSIEDCIYRARWGIKDHLKELMEGGLPIPSENPNPVILVCNETPTGAWWEALDNLRLRPAAREESEDYT